MDLEKEGKTFIHVWGYTKKLTSTRKNMMLFIIYINGLFQRICDFVEEKMKLRLSPCL